MLIIFVIKLKRMTKSDKEDGIIDEVYFREELTEQSKNAFSV